VYKRLASKINSSKTVKVHKLWPYETNITDIIQEEIHASPNHCEEHRAYACTETRWLVAGFSLQRSGFMHSRPNSRNFWAKCNNKFGGHTNA
jgi:hypothetical protein